LVWRSNNMLWLCWTGLARVHSHTDVKMALDFMAFETDTGNGNRCGDARAREETGGC
jgi:hypothetical protein